MPRVTRWEKMEPENKITHEMSYDRLAKSSVKGETLSKATNSRRCLSYNMEDFFRQCLQRYEECCKSEIIYKDAQTPNLDDASITDEDRVTKGHLESFASSILM